MILAFLLSLTASPVHAHNVDLHRPKNSAKAKYEWVSIDPHVHTQKKGSEGCPTAASKADMLAYGQRYNLQVVIDNYWGPHRPSAEEAKRFPLPFVENRTPEEQVHGNNHRLRLERDKKTGRPTASNLLDGLEISWFISDRGSHLGILGAKSLNWFFDEKGNDKYKTGVEVLEALHKDTEEHNNNLKKSEKLSTQSNHHFVIVSHLFQWNPRGYPQVASKDYGRPFELPITVAFEEWGVKGLGTEGLHISGNSAEPMLNSPIDTGVFDVLIKLANSGFKMSLIGESDYSCLGPDDPKGLPGNGLGKPEVLRTLIGAAKGREGEVTYQSVLDAAIAGRTVVAKMGTDFPKLGNFSISFGRDSAGLGETLKISSQGPVKVRVKNVPKSADVLVNGGLALKTSSGKSIRNLRSGSQIKGDGTITLKESSWIVATSKDEITSPIYVEINNKPIRVSTEDPCYFIGHIERAKLELAKDPKGDLNISEYPKDRKEHLLTKYREAQDIYAKRFQEAKLQHPSGQELTECYHPVAIGLYSNRGCLCGSVRANRHRESR